jgi:hypothetical protein
MCEALPFPEVTDVSRAIVFMTAPARETLGTEIASADSRWAWRGIAAQALPSVKAPSIPRSGWTADDVWFFP